MVTYCCVINCPKGQWLKTANTEGRELRRGWAGCFWLGDGHKVAVKVLARAAVTRQCDRGWRCCFHCPQGCGLEALVSQTRGIPTTTAQKRTGSLCAHCVVSGFPQRKLPKREPGRICGAFSDAVSEATCLPFHHALQVAQASLVCARGDRRRITGGHSGSRVPK